jgi:acetyl-CoA C-acetyltransferase
MSSNGMKDRVAVIGMGCSKFGERFDTCREDLIIEAVTEALEDSGLELKDIDAFWFSSYYETSGTTLSTVLKTEYKPVTRVENNCCSGADAFRNACYAVACGAYDVVMAIGLEKMKDFGYSGNPFPNLYRDNTAPIYGGPAGFAMLVPAYCEKYGVSYDDIREAMACVAYKNHSNGALNPKALYQKEIPLDKIKASPMICEPYLTIMDCSGVSDGCACAIITRSDDAKRYRKDPMYVKCVDFVAGPGTHELCQGYDYTSIGETAVMAPHSYKRAGIKNPANELDIVELHDCFTITEICLYEDLLLTERGHGWRDAIDGTFTRNGKLPVNIDGGLKSFGHPIGASGIRMIYEIWLQFNSRAGKRQLDNPKLGLAHNLGGWPWLCVSSITIVGKELG